MRFHVGGRVASGHFERGAPGKSDRRKMDPRGALAERRLLNNPTCVIAVILLVGLASGINAPPVRAAEDRAMLSLINPPAEINGIRIKRIGASLDGDPIGECWLDRPLRDEMCIEPKEIEPGPHKIEIILDPLKQSFFRANAAFTAGLHGAWILDLRKMAPDDAKPSDYLVEVQSHLPANSCVASVERILTTPSCHSDDLKAVAQAFVGAAATCRSATHVDKTMLADAVRHTYNTHFYLGLMQCYDFREVKRLPSRIIDPWLESGAWPPRTVTTSSWRWARDVLPKKSQLDGPIEALDEAALVVPPLASRLDIVDSVIAAYLNKKPATVLRAAEAAPWSLDPTTPNGHRNMLIVTDPRFFYDEAYATFVATNVTTDSNLDCSRYSWEAERITRYFVEAETLSPVAWRAVAAMMERVPPDGSFEACARAFDPTQRSAVSQGERLRHLARLDCAPSRAQDLRGRTLRRVLAPRLDQIAIDNDVRAQLETEFADCVNAR